MTVNSEEFERIDKIFREEGRQLLDEIGGVLSSHGIEGYRVTHVSLTQEELDPNVCLPYCIYIWGDGIRCGIWCLGSTVAERVRE